MHVQFTLVNLASILGGLATDAPLLRGLSASWSPAIAVVFYAARLLDATAYSRLGRKLNLRPAPFHILNFAAHALPLVIAYRWRSYATSRRARMALALHLAWGAIVSRGTMRLDDVYVPMPPRLWKVLWALTVACECLPALPRSEAIRG